MHIFYLIPHIWGYFSQQNNYLEPKLQITVNICQYQPKFVIFIEYFYKNTTLVSKSHSIFKKIPHRFQNPTFGVGFTWVYKKQNPTPCSILSKIPPHAVGFFHFQNTTPAKYHAWAELYSRIHKIFLQILGFQNARPAP